MLGESKYFGSGQKCTSVPVLRLPTEPTTLSASAVSPFSKAMTCSWPLRRIRHSSRFDSALTTDTPTPWSPPEKV
jgi:hypothetical protein